MIKKVVAFTVIFILILIHGYTASADEIEDFTNEISSSAQQGLPEDARDELSDMGIDLAEPESLSRISVSDIAAIIRESLLSGFVKPTALLGKLIGIILICSLVSSFSDGNGKLQNVTETSAALCTVTLVFDFLADAAQSLIGMLSSLSGFMTAYLPVFVSVTTAGNGIASASGSSLALLSLCEIVSVCADRILPAVCSVILAVAIAQSVSPMKSSGIANGIRKICNKSIAFVSTIFSGIVSITGVVGACADSVSVRCAKFTASSFVPVIGSAVADAYTTVRGSLSLVRTATGAFGIITVLVIALRPVASAVGLSVVVSVAKTVAEMFSIKTLKAFLSGVSDLMSVLLVSSVLLSLMFVVSTAVLVMSCMNI